MKKIAAAAILTLSSLCASASVLTGDAVTISFDPIAFTRGFTVGAGEDLTLTNVHFHLDGGAGNRFIFTNGPAAGSFAGSTSFTLSGLDVTDSSTLTGFSLISPSLSGFSYSFTGNSITFNYINGSAPLGTVIDGIFETTRSAVPLPGTLPLFLLGMGALGLMRSRRSAGAV